MARFNHLVSTMTCAHMFEILHGLRHAAPGAELSRCEQRPGLRRTLPPRTTLYGTPTALEAS